MNVVYNRKLLQFHHCVDGYRDFSFTRASAVLKRQLTGVDKSLLRLSQALVSPCIVSQSGMRRSRHWRLRTLIWRAHP